MFPSHQGLLAPLWRRWPQRFSVLALWLGAALPDPIDGAINLVRRGELGQGAAHSLVGALLLDVPIGWLLLAALRPWLQRASARPWRYLAAIDRPRGLGRDAAALAIGCVSHVLFDLLSHERARLLWPFADDPDWFGSWWRAVWFRFSAPGCPDYPVGPHFVAWLALSALGLWLFVRWRPRPA